MVQTPAFSQRLLDGPRQALLQEPPKTPDLLVPREVGACWERPWRVLSKTINTDTRLIVFFRVFGTIQEQTDNGG